MKREKSSKLKNDIKVLQKTLSIIGEDEKIQELLTQKRIELLSLQNEEYLKTKNEEFLRGNFVVKKDKIGLVLSNPVLVNILKRHITSIITQCDAIYGREVKTIDVTLKMLRNFLTIHQTTREK